MVYNGRELARIMVRCGRISSARLLTSLTFGYPFASQCLRYSIKAVIVWGGDPDLIQWFVWNLTLSRHYVTGFIPPAVPYVSVSYCPASASVLFGLNSCNNRYQPQRDIMFVIFASSLKVNGDIGRLRAAVAE